MKLKHWFISLLVLFFFQQISAQCYYHLYMYDSYGDGWNGAYIEVTMNGVHVGDFECYQSFDLDSVYSFTGANMDFIFHSGNWDSEITFTIMDPMGDTLVDGPAPSDLDNLMHTSNSTCPSTIACLNPIYLNAGSITDSSANLSWTPGAVDTLWNLHWDTSSLNSHPMYGNGTTVNGLNSNNYNLNGLNSYTNYDFYVQAVCDSGSNSIWSGPFSFTTNVIQGTCGIYTLMLNDSYGDGWNGGFLDIYSNGNLISSNVTIINGFGPEVTPISVDSGDVIDIIYTAGGWPEENSYILFDQLNSIIVSQTPLLHNGPPSTNGIIGCASCGIPQNLMADNITINSADLTWTAGSNGGLSWNIEWGVSGFIQGNGTTLNNVNSTVYSLTNLNPSTDYSFYVQEVCNPNDSSSWSGPFTFSTSSLPLVAGSCGMFQVALYDTYGDGWNGGILDIEVNFIITQTITLQNGSGPEYFDIPVDSADFINILYSPGAWEDENSYEVYDENNILIASEAGANGQGPASTTGLTACQPLGTGGGNNGPCGWFILEIHDSLSDGWNGSYISIELDGVPVHNSTMLAGIGTEIFPFMVDSNQTIDIIYHENGSLSHIGNSYLLMDNMGNVVSHQIGSSISGPANTQGIIGCENSMGSISKNNENVIIYPNPSKDLFFINSAQNIDRITVYNIIGEIILEEKPNKKQIAVDVSKWPNNIYTIRINRKDIQITEKLIIQH